MKTKSLRLRTLALVMSILVSSPFVVLAQEEYRYTLTWKYECTGVVVDYSKQLYDPTAEWGTLEPCEGIKIVSAFKNRSGDTMLIEIPYTQYAEMKKTGGAVLNPNQTDIIIAQ